MLETLYIENIAVIEKTTIDFTNGFNVLTGETGAGKSIVIDSINALMGHRTSKDIIRTGADFAFVSGIFSLLPKEVEQKFSELGFENDDGQYIIQRQISVSGKNTCRINGRPVALSVLKDLASNLINIHGQHESYQLMAPDKHVTYIDSIGMLRPLLEEYRQSFHVLKDIKHRLNSAQSDDSQRQRKIDLLRYQIDELEQADLQIGEYEQLNEEKTLLINSEKISDAFKGAYINLSGEEIEKGALELIEEASDNLDSISEYMPEAASIAERVTNALYELKDCTEEIYSLSDISDADPYRLNEIEERLDILYRLSRKYGSTTEDMLEFLDNAKRELEEIEQYEDNMEKLNADFELAFEKCKKLALELSKKRKDISDVFCKKVKEEMIYLDMPNVNLTVSNERCPLSENGCDKIEFLISNNPGEPPKPVSKIASGGELSRMMLAIKNVLSNNDVISTLIFDEVDTGISGSAAQKVGLKLKSLSESKQVICVTHQAQIAALAHSHFLIKKEIKNGRTYTNVKELDFQSRKQELARIIGGVSITELTLKHAEEMLRN